VGSRIVARRPPGPNRRGRLAAAGAVALLLGFGLLGLAAPGGGIAAGVWEGALYLLPALLLLLVLLARHYPGERLLGALVARRARRARVRVLAAVRRPALPVPHGGRLIAVSLAGRAPPPARAGACV
jgi:hypothetical protein